MITVLKYLAAAAIGYLLGCSNMALYLSRLKGVDLRQHGSGNLGASNAMIVIGWKAAVIVGLHDIGKAALAVLLAMWLFGGLRLVGAVAGVCCVIGHIYPFYLKFHGGKGFASYLGMTLALSWKLGLVILVVVALVTLITDYIVLGTATTVIAVPTCLGIFRHDLLLAAVLCVATVLILLKHRENFVRIWKGTEIGLRRANRGEGRQ